MANKNRKKEFSPKLVAKWKGPGLITRMHGDVTAEVQFGAHQFTRVHTYMLKPCKPRHCPQWLWTAQTNLQAWITAKARPITQYIGT